MATLYRRASPAQHRMLRIVEGAVKNAADAHPEITISPQFRRSVAKRAAGTLSAQWPEVLAANAKFPSDKPEEERLISAGGRSHHAKGARGWSHLDKADPLKRLERRIAMPLRALKLSGQHEKAAAYIDVLRMIASLRAPDQPPEGDGCREAYSPDLADVNGRLA